MAEARIIIAHSSRDIAAVKSIFLDYLSFIEDVLNTSLDVRDRAREFAGFPGDYERLYLAKIDNIPVAACGTQPVKPGICELKRLYCRPEGRGHNFGERLTLKAIEGGRELGYTQICLDTDPALTHAVRIYEKLGFKDIERSADNPLGCSRYMALEL